jgi:hypothetical protein
MIAFRFGLRLIVVTSVITCIGGGARFTTEFASDFAPAQHVVSVLGVYQDGRMSTRGWDTLSPYLARSLGSSDCDVGYDSLVSSNETLAEAIDEYARADGPTDDLLAQLAPAAQGDLVLVLTFAGKLPERPVDAGAAAPSPPGGGGQRGGHRGGGSRVPPGKKREGPKEDTNQLEISASLFSVAGAHSVALIGMQYPSANIDEAMTKFAAKLGESLPGMKCVGWNWNADVDPERIRAKMNE